jgi:hypothetical protein
MMIAIQRLWGRLEWALERLLSGPRGVIRSKRPFGVATSTDGGMTFANAYPVDISVDGVALISTQEIKTMKMLVTIDLDHKRIEALARCVSAQKGKLKGNVVWRIGARFIDIARDDRALIHRFVKRLPLTAAPKQEHKKPQQHGLFPDSIIQNILNQLVHLKRLAPLHHGRQPLVKMTHNGIIERGKQKYHSVKIESRIVHDGTTTIYSTQAYVSERLTKIEVIPLDEGRPELIVPTSLRKPSSASKLHRQGLFAS